MSTDSNGGGRPDVGETTYSFQHRCTQWHVHQEPNKKPYPCEGCYTLAQVNVVVPYRDRVGFTRV